MAVFLERLIRAVLRNSRQQLGINRHHVEHPVQIGDHIPEEFPHSLLGVLVVAQILHFSFKRKIERLLGRLIEANASKDIPMP